jgi:hypothetical protein
MKYCSKCKVSVAGQRKYCPLCQRELQSLDTDNNETFPEIPTIFHQYNLFFRVLILLSVIVSVVSAVINFLERTDVWWSLFVAAGIACLWLSMAIAVSKRRNIPKNILYQVVVLSTLAIVWDWGIGWRAWSINYVVPAACTLAMISMAIISKVTNLRVEDYMIYLVIDGLFCIVPVIFIFTGFLTVRYPSILCAAASVISLTALILFEGDHMWSELKRRLHV